MKPKRKLSQGCRLYLVLDAQVSDHRRLWSVLQAGANNGVDIVQLRDKLGAVQKVLEFTQRAQRYLKGRIPFIVNDRADVAAIAGASGVHVGQDDLSVGEARRICGPKALVGRSCQTLAHVLQAEADGADYIGFGSVFKTLTKPDRIPMDLELLRRVTAWAARADLPVFAIGGITRDNIRCVCDRGVTRVAVCRDVLLARDPARAVRALKKALTA